MLAIPNKFLFDLVRVRAEGVARGRSHLRCGIAANGHGVPGHVGQVAAYAGRICARKTVIHTVNADNSAGKALGGIVRIHLADGPFAGDLGRVRECDGHSPAATVGQGHILGSSVVDLVSFRRFQFHDGICRGVQAFERIGPVAPGHDLLFIGPVF